MFFFSHTEPFISGLVLFTINSCINLHMKKKEHWSRLNRIKRIERIERKCDRILSELLILRQRLRRTHDIDESIEQMHTAARRLREQCERERETCKKYRQP